MTQGIWINGERPKSKKAVKEAIAEDPSRVRLEATSLMGNEYDGPVSGAPAGTHDFVGPDPYTKRNFYGNIIVTESKCPGQPLGTHVYTVVDGVTSCSRCNERMVDSRKVKVS